MRQLKIADENQKKNTSKSQKQELFELFELFSDSKIKSGKSLDPNFIKA
ncbi:11658_t:CDS:2 [Diversispora eburnea]|uniref:11658_t:CDS:1 n=1 Tax=Diversispora eburnea TaxID=1213867 RepID=A0A9N9BEU9_9GLOM|nr:11658_t:CDS:2 [Diversispora eburnea]